MTRSSIRKGDNAKRSEAAALFPGLRLLLGVGCRIVRELEN